MPRIKLTGQKNLHKQLEPKLAAFQSQLSLRRAAWERLGHDQRRAWLHSGKDDLLTLAFTQWQYLNSFFGGPHDYL